MHVSGTKGAIKASYLVLAGCGVLLAWILVAVLRNRNDAVMSPAAALAAISALHGVAWPSNTVTTAFVIWNYRAASDGNSLNTETLAKLETDDDSFLIWYSYATNILSEHRHASVSYDARFSEKAKWWRPDELGETNDGLLSHELSQPTGVHSKLSLLVGTTGTNRVIYLHCIVRQP